MKNIIRLLSEAKLEIGKSKGYGLGAFYLLLIWLAPFVAALLLGQPVMVGLSPVLHAVMGQ